MLQGCCNEVSTSGRQHGWTSRTSTANCNMQHRWRCPPAGALVLPFAEPHASTAFATPLDQARALTAGIKNCEKGRRIRKLLTKYRSVVNHVHACAALTRLTALCPQPDKLEEPSRSEFLEFCHDLLNYLSSNLSLLSARELSNVLAAAAKLGLQPSHAFLSELADAVQQRVDMQSARDCGSTAWALARLNYHPGSSWCSTFIARCQVCLPRMDSQALSNLLWAFARWGRPLPEPFIQSVASCVEARLPQFSSQGLATVLWAFCKLQYLPPPAWMDAYWDTLASKARSSSTTPAELSLVIFAAGKLGCSLPAPATLQLLTSYLTTRVHELSFTGAAWAMWGFSMLRHRPDPLMHPWFEHTQSLMDHWASARRSASTPNPDVVDGDDGRAPAVDSKSLSNVLHALQRFQASSGGSSSGAPAAWLQAAVAASAALMDSMDVRSLAVTGLCLAKLGATVDGAWLASYASASQQAVGSMSSAEVVNVLCALSRFHHVPSEEFMCRLMTHVHQEMMSFKANELANGCLALAHLSKSLATRAEPCARRDGKLAGMWEELHMEVRHRWLLLPAAPGDVKTVGILRRALHLARQDASWLQHVT